MPYQFKQLGVKTYGLGFPDRLIMQCDSYAGKYEIPGSPRDLRFSQIVKGVSRAVQECQPDFLLTIDETLIRGLLQLRENIRTTDKPLSDNVRRILNLLDRSLVEKPQMYQRHTSLSLAKEAGFPIPNHFVASSEEELLEIAGGLTGDHFIKISFAAGGTGVIHIPADQPKDQLLANIKKSGYYITNIQNALIQLNLKVRNSRSVLPPGKGSCWDIPSYDHCKNFLKTDQAPLFKTCIDHNWKPLWSS